ncbi:hypothetical protein, partial [Thomasclavelia sp.]
ESQAAINEATQALSDAYSNLRIKPDESIIEDLRKFLDETKDLDYSKYSVATQIKIKDAIKQVKATLTNENTTNEELVKVHEIVKATRQLINNPDAKNNQDTTVDQSKEGVKTGDTCKFMIPFVLMAGSAAIILNKRTKKS